MPIALVNSGADVGKTPKAISCLFVSILLISAALAGGESGTTVTHDQTACPTCHSLRADISPSSEPRVDFDRQCRKCHSGTLSNPIPDSLGFHFDQERACLDCHSFHDPTMISVAGQSFRLEFHNVLLRFQCGTCHNQKGDLAKLGNGHRQAATLYHSDLPLLTSMSPSDRCLICHSKRSVPLPIPESEVAPPRFAEHASHPFGVPVKPGEGSSGGRLRLEIDPQITLYDGRIECQSCHCLTTGNAQLLIMSEQAPTPVCLGCHSDN